MLISLIILTTTQKFIAYTRGEEGKPEKAEWGAHRATPANICRSKKDHRGQLKKKIFALNSTI